MKSNIIEHVIVSVCPVFAGYMSVRHIEEGAVFLQAVARVFSKFACRENLLDMATRVRIRKNPYSLLTYQNCENSIHRREGCQHTAHYWY